MKCKMTDILSCEKLTNRSQRTGLLQINNHSDSVIIEVLGRKVKLYVSLRGDICYHF